MHIKSLALGGSQKEIQPARLLIHMFQILELGSEKYLFQVSLPSSLVQKKKIAALANVFSPGLGIQNILFCGHGKDHNISTSTCNAPLKSASTFSIFVCSTYLTELISGTFYQLSTPALIKSLLITLPSHRCVWSEVRREKLYGTGWLQEDD